MNAYVALLRASNVGGTGKLAMSDLKAMCDDLGFVNTKTYIASGNVLFQSNLSESKVKVALEAKLASYASKPVGVLVRTAQEMAAESGTSCENLRAPARGTSTKIGATARTQTPSRRHITPSLAGA